LQHESGYIVWLVILITLVVLFLAWQYLGYRAVTHTLPTGMTMAGISVEDMTREQALNCLEVALATPLSVSYPDRRLMLSPHTVDLRYDANQTAASLDAALADWRGLAGFLVYLLRCPIESSDVPVAVSYSEVELSHFLSRVADECQEMINWMSENRIESLMETGLPVGTRVAHKHGWISDTHADAGLVFTPGGDYVLVIFLHRLEWLPWEESAPLIADISTAAYNCFNPSQ
jgi:hypothetical protein